jgi:hypothetical protein
MDGELFLEQSKQEDTDHVDRRDPREQLFPIQ